MGCQLSQKTTSTLRLCIVNFGTTSFIDSAKDTFLKIKTTLKNDAPEILLDVSDADFLVNLGGRQKTSYIKVMTAL
jgi:hypothetical protein